MDELLREIMLINRLLLIFYSRSVKIKKTTVISEKEIIAMENTKIDRRVRKTKALLFLNDPVAISLQIINPLVLQAHT